MVLQPQCGTLSFHRAALECLVCTSGHGLRTKLASKCECQRYPQNSILLDAGLEEPFGRICPSQRMVQNLRLFF